MIAARARPEYCSLARRLETAPGFIKPGLSGGEECLDPSSKGIQYQYRVRGSVCTGREKGRQKMMCDGIRAPKFDIQALTHTLDLQADTDFFGKKRVRISGL